jgi:hypothetical protein
MSVTLTFRRVLKHALILILERKAQTTQNGAFRSLEGQQTSFLTEFEAKAWQTNEALINTAREDGSPQEENHVTFTPS